MTQPFGPIWTAPIVLGVLTMVGLISALVGDGVWDALSAVTLGAVVAVGGYYSLRRPRLS
jgi:membrane associated rhomboid family serine protease